MTKKKNTKNKKILSQIKKIRGKEREEHFKNGKPLSAWIEPTKIQSNSKDKRNQTRKAKKLNAIRDSKGE